MTAKPLPYRVGVWANQPNYECELCPYSTLEKQLIEEHIAETHAPAPASRPLIYVPVGETLY